MKKICNNCQSEMIGDCSVKVEDGAFSFKITQKGKGFFNNVSAVPKAAICPNCGNVAFYVEEYKQFKR